MVTDLSSSPLPRNSDNQYVILAFDLSAEEKIKIEEFEFSEKLPSKDNKVYLEFDQDRFQIITSDGRLSRHGRLTRHWLEIEKKLTGQ